MIRKFCEKLKELIIWFTPLCKSKYLIWIISKLKIEKYWNDKKNFKKWDILRINFWYNIWTEINKERYALVISPNFISRFSRDLVVLPISSIVEWKYYKNKPDLFYEIKTIDYSFLENDSYILFNKIQNISKKRIIKKEWKIHLNDRQNIFERMFSLYNK